MCKVRLQSMDCMPMQGGWCTDCAGQGSDRAGQSSIHLPGEQQKGWVRRRRQPSGWAPVQHWGLVLCPGWGWAGWWGWQQLRPVQGQLPGHLDGGVHWALRWVMWLCQQLAGWWEVVLQTGPGQAQQHGQEGGAGWLWGKAQLELAHVQVRRQTGPADRVQSSHVLSYLVLCHSWAAWMFKLKSAKVQVQQQASQDCRSRGGGGQMYLVTPTAKVLGQVASGMTQLQTMAQAQAHSRSGRCSAFAGRHLGWAQRCVSC